MRAERFELSSHGWQPRIITRLYYARIKLFGGSEKNWTSVYTMSKYRSTIELQTHEFWWSRRDSNRAQALLQREAFRDAETILQTGLTFLHSYATITSRLQKLWSPWVDSNHQPLSSKPSRLPDWHYTEIKLGTVDENQTRRIPIDSRVSPSGGLYGIKLWWTSGVTIPDLRIASATCSPLSLPAQKLLCSVHWDRTSLIID